MDYSGGVEKKSEMQNKPVFEPEIFSDTSDRRVEQVRQFEDSRDMNEDDIEITLPPGMEIMNDSQQAVVEAEEIERREHKNAKMWAMDVKEDIERDGDNPRKLQEDWVKRANNFLEESYSRRWGDRN